MIGWVLRAALMIALVCAGLIGGVRARYSPDEAIRGVLTPPDLCASPCWGGIVIGVTSRDEAIRLLESNAWVSRIYERTTFITWEWSGAQSPLIDSTWAGVIGLQNERVARIRIQTHIPYGAVWLSLGIPDNALMVRPVSRSTAFQIFTYERERIQVISTLRCPALPQDLWYSTITLGMGDLWSTESLNSIRFNVYHLPGWWAYLHSCRPPRGTPAR